MLSHVVLRRDPQPEKITPARVVGAIYRIRRNAHRLYVSGGLDAIAGHVLAPAIRARVDALTAALDGISTYRGALALVVSLDLANAPAVAARLLEVVDRLADLAASIELQDRAAADAGVLLGALRSDVALIAGGLVAAALADAA